MTTPSETIAVVTGSNRGIGLEIVRQLARRGATAVLTARDPEAGRAAVRALEAEGLRVDFHPLSVTDEAGVQSLREFLETKFGRLDVLVNNAGVGARGGGTDVALQTVRDTLEVNTLAPLRLVQVLAPLLAKSARGRVVNVSSELGALGEMGSRWAAYRISKAALNAVTGILAAELPAVAVNSMCPGWVRTDMGGRHADRDVAQGADTAVWLALDAPQSLTGKFLRDRRVIPW